MNTLEDNPKVCYYGPRGDTSGRRRKCDVCRLPKPQSDLEEGEMVDDTRKDWDTERLYFLRVCSKCRNAT